MSRLSNATINLLCLFHCLPEFPGVWQLAFVPVWQWHLLGFSNLITLSLSRSPQFSKCMRSLFVACIIIGWLPLTNVLRVYNTIYSQLASQSKNPNFGTGITISVVPNPTRPDCHRNKPVTYGVEQNRSSLKITN